MGMLHFTEENGQRLGIMGVVTRFLLNLVGNEAGIAT